VSHKQQYGQQAKSKHRLDQSRIRVAQEAARIIHEHGLSDFRAAKAKAAENLGLNQQGALPSNAEVEQAIAEHNRIFREDQQLNDLIEHRHIAALLMHDLNIFKPRLVGAVLSGNITEHSSVDLHLYSDTSEAVGMLLDSKGFCYQPTVRKHSMRKGQTEEFPCYRFNSEDTPVSATVFPEKRQSHAPICPINGKPMQRAKLRDLEELIYGAEYGDPEQADQMQNSPHSFLNNGLPA